ncbi:DNA cytosine methyltransferase [Pseudomonas aeruginosa]|nr:DNA cytosine methyltransferase [Pseudomonas aeruginosa]
MSGAYYNEIDPYAAQWLRNLIAAGHIAPGDVDERSIEDVHPDDLKHYTQCHFFAGIGVWSLALRRAGWPDDRPVWTGSCPCQPYSQAGQGLGFDDPRHLWPHFAWLIRERRPGEVLGEQVASKDAEPWLDLVQADLEAMDYAFGAVAFPSAGIGAPHIRDRTYWVAHANGDGCEQPNSLLLGWQQNEASGDPSGGMPWSDVEWIVCPDGKKRPCKPGIDLLADGHSFGLDQLRAYGNAINAGAATQFIAAYLDATS